MLDDEAHPFDVCHCGDYRHQHENETGKCKLGSLCTPTPCSQFRLFRRRSPYIPDTEEDAAELMDNGRNTGGGKMRQWR